ncbi:phage tail tube protein [Denitromonas halophila]|uniref:Phage tail protein n=1 Tax=Denitromonas halophila TaxID=1629404 RepID=A0A557QJS5_9RHOO|nr:phage tail tube protein [Denitromonas halophila]TVO53160.1 phage tail protein [Denitromonas halophila]
MTVKTQGTHLFFIAPGATPEVIKVGAIASISGINASRDQIETTDLDSVAHEYDSGLMAPGAASFEIRFDPKNTGHKKLHELFVSGTVLEWALGWSDGTDPAVLDGVNNEIFDLPTTRSFLQFQGYVADCPFDFSLNSIVSSSISVQISGFPALIAKA